MTEARWAGTQQDLYAYQLVLRPWLWLLTRTSDCRIFKQMTPIDIIKQVFSDRGFSDFRDATTGSPPTLEYCVQYRETDFNFVCRLMEEYGVYYFFEHSDGKHTLVLADAKSSHKPVPGLSSLPYNPVADAGRKEQQYLETWSLGRRAQSGVFVLEDYGYKKPSANLLAQSQNPGGYAHDSMEMFDYTYSYVDTEGNDLVDQGVGEKLRKIQGRSRPVARQAPLFDRRRAVTISRRADHARTPSGRRREQGISGHPLHSRLPGGEPTVRAAAPSFGYVGNYEMTPSDRQFRAPLVTRKPEIVGYQSALVIKDRGKARRSTSTRSGGSSCSSIGTARRSHRAGSGSRRSGRGAIAARCSRPASATRS